MNQKKYLVATDLTEASDMALKCATQLAKMSNSEIILLHIFEVADVDENAKRMLSSSFLNRDIKRQLQEQVQETEDSEKVNISYLTKEGELFSEMNAAAKETNSDYLFIGTHGVHGIQHITGSFIAKTINTSEIPVWVIQKDTKLVPYKNIIVYVDEFPEEALHSATLDLAKNFGSEIHFIFSEPANTFSVKDSVQKATAKLDSLNIKYTFSYFSGETDKIKSLENFAKEKEAPLIIIDRNHKPVDKMVPILTNNHHIEVLCLNSK